MSQVVTPPVAVTAEAEALVARLGLGRELAAVLDAVPRLYPRVYGLAVEADESCEHWPYPVVLVRPECDPPRRLRGAGLAQLDLLDVRHVPRRGRPPPRH